MRWLDVTGKVTGTNHAVHRHHELFSTLTEALEESFAAGGRVTLGDVARWHAAARADEVLVRNGDRIALYRRRDTEPVAAFAARLPDLARADGDARPEDAAAAGLQLVMHGDLPCPDGADVYALYPAGIAADAVRLLTAADVVAALAP
jgi:hypothetical protein